MGIRKTEGCSRMREQSSSHTKLSRSLPTQEIIGFYMYVRCISYSHNDLYKNRLRSFSRKKKKKGRLHSGKLCLLKMQSRDHGDKQLNWKVCCCGMSAVLPLDRSIREVGETREAVSKYALLKVLRLK